MHKQTGSAPGIRNTQKECVECERREIERVFECECKRERKKNKIGMTLGDK